MNPASSFFNIRYGDSNDIGRPALSVLAFLSGLNTSNQNNKHYINNHMDVFELVRDLGTSIATTVVLGVFIFIVLKQMLDGVVDEIKTLTMFCKSLENGARTMSNEMIKIDTLVSSALELRPDIERVARAENFIEDGKLDVRRD